MNYRETGWSDMDWIHLAEGRGSGEHLRTR